MSVIFGYPVWIGSIKDDILSKTELLKKQKIDLLEVSLEYPWPYKYTDKLSELISRVKDDEFRIGLHAPWRDLPYATPYTVLDQAILDVIISSYEFLVREGAVPEYIVVHPYTMQKIDIFDNRRDIINSLRRRTIALAEKTSSIILLENLTKGFAGEITYLVESINGLENAGICLDVGHLAARFNRELASHYDSFYDYLDEVVDVLRDTMVPVIHIHDVDRLNREHLLIGEGILEFKRIYKSIAKLNPRFIVYEIFRSNKIKPSIEKIAGIIGEQASWARIYIH